MGGRFIVSGLTLGLVLAEFLGLCRIGTRSGLVMRFVYGDLTQANGIASTGLSEPNKFVDGEHEGPLEAGELEETCEDVAGETFTELQ